MENTKKKLNSIFRKQQHQGREYFINWTYEEPLLISSITNSKVNELQKIIHKIIQFFVKNYDSYEKLMPLGGSAKRVLSFFDGKDYQVGSYRTDFVVDELHQFRLIEITCRFAFNGYWVSGFLNNMAKEYAEQFNIDYDDQFSGFLNYLEKRLDGNELVILSHKGKGEESRHYQRILASAGYKIKKVFIEDAERELEKIEGKVFITEFNQEEYYSLSDKSLKQLAKADVINDLRTVFLIHDKRFFSILGNSSIRKKALNLKEIQLLDQFYVPTYCFGEAPNEWRAAQRNKGNWILKHKHLGKSDKVFAGLVTDEKVWQQLLRSKEVEEMVLQPFINQPRFRGRVNNKSFCDYFVGTMLFFDNSYFGIGIWRASSHPVSNVVDDRKIMHLHLKKNKNEHSLKEFHIF